MDYEDIANLSNFTFEHDITPEESSRFIAHEIIFSIFCIVGICTDAAIIYTIFRFQRARTVANIFLANWAIDNLCSLIVTPSSYRIISVIDHFSISQEFMCVLYMSGSLLHVTEILFVMLVTVDWLMAAYFPRASGKFRKNYTYVIGCMWVTFLVSCSITIVLCIHDYFFYTPDLLLVCSFCALLLLVVVLQFCRGVQKCRRRPLEYPTLTLTLATAFVLSYTLSFLNMIIAINTYYHPLFEILSAILAFSSSIVNFILLYNFNKDFQACFLQAIRRTGKYEESISDFDIPANDAGGDKYSIQVSFHNPTEELLTNAY